MWSRTRPTRACSACWARSGSGCRRRPQSGGRPAELARARAAPAPAQHSSPLPSQRADALGAAPRARLLSGPSTRAHSTGSAAGGEGPLPHTHARCSSCSCAAAGPAAPLQPRHLGAPAHPPSQATAFAGAELFVSNRIRPLSDRVLKNTHLFGLSLLFARVHAPFGTTNLVRCRWPALFDPVNRSSRDSRLHAGPISPSALYIVSLHKQRTRVQQPNAERSQNGAAAPNLARAAQFPWQRQTSALGRASAPPRVVQDSTGKQMTGILAGAGRHPGLESIALPFRLRCDSELKSCSNADCCNR